MADMDLPPSSSDDDDDGGDTSESVQHNQKHPAGFKECEDGAYADTAANPGSLCEDDRLCSDATDILPSAAEQQQPTDPIAHAPGASVPGQCLDEDAADNLQSNTDQARLQDAFELQFEKMQLREKSRMPFKAS